MPRTTVQSRMEGLKELLQRQFGFSSFRPMQEEIITTVIEGHDLFATLSTGSGKSLCFQAPALIDPAGELTLVISPLIALMHDQVNGLLRHGVPAAYLNSTLSEAERRDVVGRIPKGELRLLYLSPEALNTARIYEDLGAVRVKRLVVDEAHCVSMWGQDFRPEYGKIPQFRRKLGNPQLLAFTATAPVVVRDEVVQMLELNDAVQYSGEVDRPNISLVIEHIDWEEDKWAYLLQKLRAHAKSGEPTIVYCRRISTVEEIGDRLRAVPGISFRTYHGDVEKELRPLIEKEFLQGAIPILVATKAFGMGVDHPNIRHIYHYEVPESLSEYWQEVGRAGRDGQPSRATLIYSRHDIGKVKSFVQSSNPGLAFVRRIYDMLWKTGLHSELAAEGPNRNFVMRRFLGKLHETDPHVEHMVCAALAQLQTHGVVEQWSNKLFFKVTPKEVEKSGFPITREMLDGKRDRDLLTLKVMLAYAISTTEEAKSLILDHFRTNRVVELVKDMPLRSFYRLPEDVAVTVCEAIAERDIRKGDLAGYLAGTNKVAGPFAAKLKGIGRSNMVLDLEEVASLAYIRHVKLAEETWFSITELGLELLANHGKSPAPVTTWELFKRRVFSPTVRAMLRELLGDWFRFARRSTMRPQDWWALIRNFMQERFELFGKKVTGEELVRAYQHFSSTTRMLDRYGKEMLNDLFDNVIVT